MQAVQSGDKANGLSTQRKVRNGRSTALPILLAAMLTGSMVGGTICATTAGAQSPQPETKLPRFVSLKANRVNLRQGPGTDYPTSWVFRRAGLPVEILKEFEAWRQVRDAEGTTGWVLAALLSGRRTAQVLPWEAKKSERPRVALTSRESENSKPIALVEAGVIADVHECDGEWCLVSVDKYRGYIAQNKLWGVYAGEIIK